ncbi:MAG: 2-succinyl-5-enolpyruvyl-6-hydroxy-3-cyclohexene-1-carboxylic-acid synthase, partial [Burkholderiales bacterium]|nr:2-succinyl-5-enolpyruvyl-6-hydroxy-3-cyclohexene-1-carboxylic-acid synthase [Opitutaceae bacterium]
MNLDFRNTNALWCSVAAETLFLAGVRHAVISPGSRNTPLTMALVAHAGIETTPVLDERSAAFFGLGIAKRTGAPVLLVCTSGSAGAHYLPAVIEAKESGTPLIVVTADRPPEMRDCASGQTIDQQKLFGGFVDFYHELAVPEPRVELLRYLRQTLRHAVVRARAGGPVHLNAPFRDPLPPIEDDSARPLACAVEWNAFFALPAEAAVELVQKRSLPADFIARRGVIVAGIGFDQGACALAHGAGYGWPVLADAISGARLRVSTRATVIAGYDAILRDERAAEQLRPEAVVIFGDVPTSKVLRAWLARCDAPIVQFTRHGDNRDGLHGRTRRILARPEELDEAPVVFHGAPPEWEASWARAEAAAQGVLAAVESEAGFEGAFSRSLAETLTRGQTLVVASSMPVRDLEYFAPVRGDGPRVVANRGANGIDGTLSTALGVAHGGEPAVLLTGDLALLHDTNGFLVAARLRGSLTVVVINNEGGGIFGHLPVAAFNPPFEEYWATPQRVDFAKLCAAYSVTHYMVATPAELRELLRARVGEPGLRVVEVRTDRVRDAATRKRRFAAA